MLVWYGDNKGGDLHVEVWKVDVSWEFELLKGAVIRTDHHPQVGGAIQRGAAGAEGGLLCRVWGSSRC